MTLHADLPDSDIHVPGYVQNADPGAIGAGKVWVDTSGGTGNWVVKVRNVADSGWESVSGTGGGGGLSSSYVGYNTVGGSTETVTGNQMYAKKVTVASAGIFLDIEAYIDTTSDGSVSIGVCLLDDNAGAPNIVLSSTLPVSSSAVYHKASNPRWQGTPLGRYVSAGDYWIAVSFTGVPATQLRYDAGSDSTWNNGSWILADAIATSVTTSARKYSIRASFLAL